MKISVTKTENGFEMVNTLFSEHPVHRYSKHAKPKLVSEVRLLVRTEKGDKNIGTVESGIIYAIVMSSPHREFGPGSIIVGKRGDRVVACALCESLNPEMFLVSNEDWDYYIIPQLQDKWLCRECYDKQKKQFRLGWKNGLQYLST